MKIINFRGDLTDNSAKKEALSGPVMFFKPKYRLGPPENYIFIVSHKINLVSKYPKKNDLLLKKTSPLWS